MGSACWIEPGRSDHDAGGPSRAEFVNSVIGYRVRREGRRPGGQITVVSIAVPQRHAEYQRHALGCRMDRWHAYGETPLGNLSIVPGEHEIVFRHPQLGERREKIIVRPAGAPRLWYAWRV